MNIDIISTIFRNPSIDVKIVVADLSGDAEKVSSEIVSQVKDLGISTLIINAGYAIPEVFSSFFINSLLYSVISF